MPHACHPVQVDQSALNFALPTLSTLPQPFPGYAFMAASPLSMRIAVMQTCPVFKDVNASIAKADAMLASELAGSLDLLVLPEMAFSGAQAKQ
jgi:hypothetical protein